MGKEYVLVILAAGDGGRLGKQKVLLEFGGRILLEHIIDAFPSASEVVVVVGYKAGRILDRLGWSRNGTLISYAPNWRWSITKTGDSLLAARGHWEGKQCVVVSGDHLFGPNLAKQVIGMNEDTCCVLADGRTDLDGEETVLIGNGDGTVEELIFPSDQMTSSKNLQGECPEIFKFSAEATRELVKGLKGNDVFEAVNQLPDVRWSSTSEPWIEIDTPGDLKRAQKVWQEILESGA